MKNNIQSFNLRPYQKECLDTILDNFKKMNKQIIQLPTGAGKTVLFWEYISKYCKSALIIVPSVQLAEQVEECSQHFVHHSLISSSVGRRDCKIIRNYHIVSSQGICHPRTINYLNKHHFEAVIIDEAHRVRANSFEEGFSKLHCYDKILGVTATPFRTDLKSLYSFFDDLTYKKRLIDLIREDYLCDLRGIRVETHIDLKNEASREDFPSASLYKQLSTDERNRLLSEIYHNHCKGLKTLLFCINIKHTEEMATLLQKQGVRAVPIHGKIDIYQRKKILQDFKDGKIDVLTNAQLLTEGFDEPSIEALILGRPTMSKVLYMQMIGRGTRKYPGKEFCKIIDVADNYQRLCSYMSIPFPDLDIRETNKKHKDNLSLLEVDDNLEKFEFLLRDYAEKEFTFTNFEGEELLNSLSPTYLESKFPEWTTWEEALFLRWKEKKMKEFDLWQASTKD